MRKIDIVLLVGIFIVAGATVVAIAASDDELDDPSREATPSPSASTSEGTDYTRCLKRPVAGECGELEWAVRVADRAGFELEPPAPEGGAPEITKGLIQLYLSAGIAEDEGNRRGILRKEGYKRVRTIAGTPVFFDGTRVTWEVGPLYVWASGAGIQKADPASSEVADLVRASGLVHYP